jgi:hypothetical protein
MTCVSSFQTADGRKSFYAAVQFLDLERKILSPNPHSGEQAAAAAEVAPAVPAVVASEGAAEVVGATTTLSSLHLRCVNTRLVRCKQRANSKGAESSGDVL